VRDELTLRAGDRDRERSAQELRRHHLDGRLDADELEERLGRAYGARTLGDLAALLGDLPALAQEVAPSTGPVERPRVGGFGLLSFAQVHELPSSVPDAYAEALDSIVRGMVLHGYDLVDRSDDRWLTFECHERPAWVPLVCVFAFPVGLVALSVRTTTRVRMDFVPAGSGRCRLTISGEARRPVRKALAAISG
jgi:Domain of unknown function (DUF1707)